MTEPAPHPEPQIALAPAEPSGDADRVLAEALAMGLARACPLPAGVAAAPVERARCADALTALEVLRDKAADPVLWGAEAPGAGADVQRSRTTQMNGRVLRRLYLSTFAFGPIWRVEPTPFGTLARVAARFRQGLDAGDYPYPFWHSADKWRSYERTRELLFIVSAGVLRAVLRSSQQDTERPHVERAWDGRWSWQSARGEEPQGALYQALFSARNPYVAPLAQAYRAFESAQRPLACVACHDPSNRARQSPLELFSYPNQALTGRHDIVRVLLNDAMPPATASASAGIADPVRRDELLGLARRFAELGDEALRFEGEPVPAP